MYIRWQSRKRRSPKVGGRVEQWERAAKDREYFREGTSELDVHWRAILVENVRVNGKPQQKHIAYLAGFTDSQREHSQEQRYVWDCIHERLDRLSNRVSPEDRKRIEAALIEKLGKPPTKARRAALDRQSARAMERWRGTTVKRINSSLGLAAKEKPRRDTAGL